MKLHCLSLLAVVIAGNALIASASDALRPTGADWPPVIGAWFWHDDDLAPEGYKSFLDAAARHSPYTLLTTSVRTRKGEITDSIIHDHIEKATRHAADLGLQIALELDVRLARRTFLSRYPNEQQQELVLKAIRLPAEGASPVVFEGRDLSDHMTGSTFPYLCLTTRLVRVYTYAAGTNGLNASAIRDITGEGVQATAAGPRKLTVTVPPATNRWACVIAAHTYLTPDVFAPHLLGFQREIIQQYTKLPLAGVMKDEWGFPPDHTGNPAHDRYWYSPAMAEAYAKLAGGRDLVRDALLMFVGEAGLQRERRVAINQYNILCRERNALVEADFYRAGKAAFGPQAMVVTHATWTPYPGAQEFRKNGLHWWEATRDIGQSDETTPYACRTALAKRWGFPLWYNQFYASTTAPYPQELWSGALSGGRLNVHPLYPYSRGTNAEAHFALLQQGLMTGMSRLRMLDFISQAPLDCPVAVIFGQANAMNWTSPTYNRVGLEIASALSAIGFPADLIPLHLAGTGPLQLSNDGHICLGPQKYRAAVLYQPEFGDARELDFFRRAARGKTSIFQVGPWTMDGLGHLLTGTDLAGPNFHALTNEEAGIQSVVRLLESTGQPRITGWSARVSPWGNPGAAKLAAPPTSGFSVLTDGTYLRIAGTHRAEGDAIQANWDWQGQSISADAVGLVAMRFASNGNLSAFAAGGLKSLRTNRQTIELPERMDIAFRTGADGKIHGVVQGLRGPIPTVLQDITTDWQRLDIPPPHNAP